MKARFIVPALFVAAAIGLSGAAATGSAHGQPAGPPDTYVTDWDAVGTQAFSAAGLTPAEGHVIFAYVAIAVYDSVMAVEGGYRALRGRRRRAGGYLGRGGGGRGCPPHSRSLPAGSGADDPRSGVRGIAGHDPGRPGQDGRRRRRRGHRRSRHRRARRRRLPGAGDLHAAEPADPRASGSRRRRRRRSAPTSG